MQVQFRVSVVLIETIYDKNAGSVTLHDVNPLPGKTGHFVEYEGMFHTFPMFPIPEGFKAIKQIVKVITPNS